MYSVKSGIESWWAWAPGVEDPAAWKRWASGELMIQPEGSPDLSFLPAKQRRRVSQLSKMALTVAHHCCPDRKPASVFCSRYGEFSKTIKLLHEISIGDPVSPTAFNLSVHNTASGLYSITGKNTNPTTAIAACSDTFEMGFIDASASVISGREKEVLLVFAEETLPPPYKNLSPLKTDLAAAFLISQSSSAIPIKFTYSKTPSTTHSKEHPVLSFIRFLLSNDRQLVTATDQKEWIWEKEIE